MPTPLNLSGAWRTGCGADLLGACCRVKAGRVKWTLYDARELMQRNRPMENPIAQSLPQRQRALAACPGFVTLLLMMTVGRPGSLAEAAVTLEASPPPQTGMAAANRLG